MEFGVDEAGRGPVLGSLFVAAVRAAPTALPAGIGDSKRLSPARREGLAADLRADDRVETAVVEVTPAAIDDPETGLNALTATAAAEAIAELFGDAPVAANGARRGADEAARAGGDRVAERRAGRPTGVVDACDVDAERFGRRIAERTSTDVEVVAEHGADESHEVVGAASVVAKVARDTHIERLAVEHGAVGSGYPSDPHTRAFLAEYVREHGDLPPFARASWQTSRDVLAAAEQSSLGAF
jgi:ribonuclease HII